MCCHGKAMMVSRCSALLLVVIAISGCSVKTYAINMVGNALASGDSVYETDDDIELVGQALPFGLKLTESLLAQSPQHKGLLLTASRGFVLVHTATSTTKQTSPSRRTSTRLPEGEAEDA